MVLRLDNHLVKDKSRSISYTIHKDKSQMNCGFKKPNKYSVARRHGRTIQKKVLVTQITTIVWSFTYSQTAWSVKSSGSQEASLPTKPVEVLEFQLSYFKS